MPILLQKRVEENCKIKVINKIEIQSLIEKKNRTRIEVIRRSKEEIRNYDFMFVAVGRSPNIKFLSKDLQKVYKKSRKPSHLFFIGDVKNKNDRQISIAMGDGIKCAMEVLSNITEK